MNRLDQCRPRWSSAGWAGVLPNWTRPTGVARLARSLFSSFGGIVLFGWVLSSGPALGQLEVLPDRDLVRAFGGKTESLSVQFRNPTDRTLELPMNVRLYQASSATLMPVGAVRPWKTLTLLAGQTVVETLRLDLPAVRVPTWFQIHWLDHALERVGVTKLVVYPDDILKRLSTLAGNEPVGLFDPANQLKPILQRLEVATQDLEAGGGLAGFDGKLAIVGPWLSQAQWRPDVIRQVRAYGKKPAAGVVVWIWISPPKQPPDRLPNYYAFKEGAATVVIVQGDAVANLPESALAQLILVRCAEIGFDPEILRWPPMTL